MRGATRAVGWCLFLPGILPCVPVSAQEAETAEFDIDRAYLADPTMFEPFLVRKTRPLREALEEGVVGRETPLLVMEHLEHPAGRIACLPIRWRTITWPRVRSWESRGWSPSEWSATRGSV